MKKNKKTRIRKWYGRHKMLVSGILLCLTGVLACVAFPEDATGGMFCVMLGIFVIASEIANGYVTYRQTDKYIRVSHKIKSQRSA